MSGPAFHQLALLLEEAIDATLAERKQEPVATVRVVVEAEPAHASKLRDGFLLPAAHCANGDADPHGFLAQERGWSGQQKIERRVDLFSAQLVSGRQAEGQTGKGSGLIFEPLQPLPQEAAAEAGARCQLCGGPLVAGRPNRWRCDLCAQALWLVLTGEVPANLFGRQAVPGRLLAAPTTEG